MGEAIERNNALTTGRVRVSDTALTCAECLTRPCADLTTVKMERLLNIRINKVIHSVHSSLIVSAVIDALIFVCCSNSNIPCHPTVWRRCTRHQYCTGHARTASHTTLLLFCVVMFTYRKPVRGTTTTTSEFDTSISVKHECR